MEDYTSLIKKYEGLRLKAYKCPAGIWTIGYGSTIFTNTRKVAPHDTITKQQAENLLNDYCALYIEPLIKIILQIRTLNSQQITALYSLIYNIGLTAFLVSNCFRSLIKNDMQSCLKNWNWCTANGQKLQGLVNRRNEEIKLFFNIDNYIKM